MRYSIEGLKIKKQIEDDKYMAYWALGLTLAGIGFYFGYKYMNTLTIRIDRYIFNKNNTIGKLYVNDTYLCDTLEDTVRDLKSVSDKVKAETAIPAGTYTTIISYSPKFQKDLPLLQNVPYFTGIRIHTGSNENHTEGCILVGKYKGTNFYADPDIVLTLINLIKQYKFCKTVIKNIKEVNQPSYQLTNTKVL